MKDFLNKKTKNSPELLIAKIVGLLMEEYDSPREAFCELLLAMPNLIAIILPDGMETSLTDSILEVMSETAKKEYLEIQKLVSERRDGMAKDGDRQFPDFNKAATETREIAEFARKNCPPILRDKVLDGSKETSRELFDIFVNSAKEGVCPKKAVLAYYDRKLIEYAAKSN